VNLGPVGELLDSGGVVLGDDERLRQFYGVVVRRGLEGS
jgi:hypothetical protein